jgi:hypothetical protein
MIAGMRFSGARIGLGVEAATGAMNKCNDNNQIALPVNAECTGQ